MIKVKITDRDAIDQIEYEDIVDYLSNKPEWSKRTEGDLGTRYWHTDGEEIIACREKAKDRISRHAELIKILSEFEQRSQLEIWSEITGIEVHIGKLGKFAHIPEGEKCVHTEHCCIIHGCKYGDPNCPVYLGYKRQSFPCMDCYSEYDPNLKVPRIKVKELERRRAEAKEYERAN